VLTEVYKEAHQYFQTLHPLAEAEEEHGRDLQMIKV
jgi:hypothetical protein